MRERKKRTRPRPDVTGNHVLICRDVRTSVDRADLGLALPDTLFASRAVKYERVFKLVYNMYVVYSIEILKFLNM